MPRAKKPATKKKATPRVNFGSRFIEVEGSALVTGVYYDPDTKTLDAVFTKGSRYRYRGVTPLVFSKFVLARSMGNFFNTNIRTKYQYQPVQKA